MSGRLKLKSIYPTFEEFSTFCMDTITEFYPRLVTDMPNSVTLKAEIERYVFKPLYRQFKNATCRYLPTEEGIDAFNNQFSNQLEEVVFDFLVYTSTNLHYFNESYTKVGENLEQGVITYNSPINQDIKNTKSNTTIAKGATAQNINLMVYNGNTSWLKAFSSYYTPQRKAELIDKFRWLFISFYVGSDEGVILVELSKALSMADGDMVITPEENEILRKVIIEKPETLIPENVRDGISIGDVEGSLVEGIIPSGILEITENGLYNVADKEGVNVNVVNELPEDNGMIYEGKYRVRYFDIDGTVLKIEYVEDGGKSTPPSNPNYNPNYLIFDEWNYDIENYIVEQPTDVGATYKTVDDATYMWCRFTTKTGLNPNLAISGFTSIDWGDGTVDTNKYHTYTKEGEYLIKIVGKINLTGTSNGALLGDQNRTNALIKCYLGDVGTMGTFTFGNAYFLEQLVLPKNKITSLPLAFLSSSKITYFTVPRNITTLGSSCFYLVPLKNISIPDTVIDIEGHALQGMQIKNISLPNIPSIKAYCFEKNKELDTIICPKTITYFQSSCLSGCSTLKNLIIKSTTVPGLYDSSAIYRSVQLIIWVNDDIIEDLKVATNWSDCASYMKPLSWYPSLTNPNE